MYWIFLLVGILLAFAAPALADMLYVGKVEIAVEDRASLRAVLDHCVSLSERPALQDAVESSSPQDDEPRLGSPPAIDMDGLAGPAEESEGAGEGNGQGTEQEEDDGNAEDTSPDLSSITTQDCRAAGIIH